MNKTTRTYKAKNSRKEKSISPEHGKKASYFRKLKEK